MTNQSKNDDEMKAEYDFSGGVRGKHYKALQQGHTVKINHPDGTHTIQHFGPEAGIFKLDPDLRQHFPTSEAVNEALRLVVKLAQVPSSVTP